jgi:glycosyltransferase involved in cell wall biosynthesis
MKILLIMDPGIPVPPLKYGGIERIVALLADEYSRLGHQVTLLAGPGSCCKGETISFGINCLQRSNWQKAKELKFVWKYLLKYKAKFDLVHNFGRLLYLLPIINRKTSKIMSYQRPVTKSNIRIINSVPNKNLIFTACSDSCRSTGQVSGTWHTIYNTVDFAKYDLAESVESDAALIFLGRLEQIKGVHTAIEVAKASNKILWIAGNIPERHIDAAYYKSHIKPEIDNDQVRYLGELDDSQKNYYLRKAAALLFPIDWEEPFGIVMIEAMACGTPVIAFARGAVREVINEHETGFVVQNFEQMLKKVDRINTIDRRQCRLKAQKRFDINVIAKEYLALTDGR